ncbi:MAG: arylesterase [Gemmatimonadota bacterium]
MRWRWRAVALLATAFVGCRADGRPGKAAPGPADTASTQGTPNQSPTIVFLGTSITAGLGVDPEQAYPQLIQAKLDSAGLEYQVVNAGVSGETSAGALSRIGWVLRQRPAVLVIETGANDGLRGQSPASVERNIQSLIDSTHQKSPTTRIILAGMRALPNLGRDYVEQFVAIYPDLARTNDIPLIPFILEGVAGIDRLNQADGIHPTPEGHRRVAENVWRVMLPTLMGKPT